MKNYPDREWTPFALFVLLTVPLTFLTPYKSYIIQWPIDAESAAELPRLPALSGRILRSVFCLSGRGASDAGKSPLAKVIAGMCGNFEGTITCGGKGVRTMTRQEFTQTITGR